MSLYADSAYPINKELEALHSVQFASLSFPGTWGTASQRIAIVNEARQGGYKAGVLEKPANPGAQTEVKLSEVVRRVVNQLAISPKDIDQTFYEQALEDGLTDVEYVENLGLVARFTCFDIFARGIGVSLRPLPLPQSGRPSQVRPPTAKIEKAWVPTIPNIPEGGDIAQELFGPWQPYIMRGLSLVPNEFRAHYELEEVQYMPSAHFLEFDYQHHEGLTRPQAEIVAGRISALNECFY